MDNWFSETIKSDFNKNVDVAGRFDGKFNLWRRVFEIHEDGAFSLYWEVIGVFDTEDTARKAKETYRRSVQGVAK